MKRFLRYSCLFLLIGFVSCVITKRQQNNGINEIKILTYNIRNARGMDEKTDYDRIAGIIRSIHPDCAALQELDSATARSNGEVILDELAKRTGMYASYSKSIDYQGGGYGIGILTKEKPLHKEVIPLPGREESRSFLIVEMPNYVIGCTHWSLTHEDRMASVDRINAAVGKYLHKPVFLAGDFNSDAISEEINLLSKNWMMLNDPSKATFPSDRPVKCIDYIWAKKNPFFSFKISITKVENEPVASDHLPVWTMVNYSKIKNNP
ncbi:MAG TPA: endonuclease/exonuclease/phosphatase family protein [Dysgonamonadaceae bacterium]|nr:endonuclease/exonuclease/phosphatase family protein [Dysgonamonadaceae bacterium]HPD43131.1 endonuclease/exonuclease/phosphatase family protein [Dysgonamonadaceae bacterium]HRU13723.1 endonuclease/exonuclease/phosphatase family protein [Dysgonamonadaceae bacterium]